MTALFIILGIILFFVLLFSIKFTVHAEYIDDFTLSVNWLFLKFTLYPMKPKKPKPEKPKKEEPPKEEPPAQPVEKKPNPFKTFYDNQGFDGVMKLISDSVDALGHMIRSFRKHFIFDDLYLWAVISKNQDAAATAIEYGNVCKDVFPLFGYICSNFKVKNYDVSIEPDFIGTFSSAQFDVRFSLRPIFLINAGIALAWRLLTKVLLKVLRSKPQTENNNNQSTNIKGGATQ